MKELPEHKNFFTIDGKKARSLLELRSILSEMDVKEFNHHVTSHKNDFASWIKDILHKDYLAEKLMKVDSKKDILILINDELLKEYEEEMESSTEFKRFIVKEFVYGMFFGLILGLVISNLL